MDPTPGIVDHLASKKLAMSTKMPCYVSLEALKTANATPDILWVVPVDKVACVFLDGHVFTTKETAITYICGRDNCDVREAVDLLRSLPMFPTPCAVVIKNCLEKAYNTKVSPVTMGKMVGAATEWF